MCFRHNNQEAFAIWKSLLVAGIVALSAFALAPGAEAHSRTNSGFTLYFGVPFYSYQVGPGWRYHDGYGWYDYGRYGDFRRHHRANRLTCNQARRLVDRSGFDRVRVVACAGRTRTFRALNRKGNHVTVYVNSRSGAIWH